MDDALTAPRARRWINTTAATVLGMLVIAGGIACSSNTPSSSSGGTGNDGTVRVDLTKEDGTPTPGGKLVYGLNAESDGFSPSLGRWASSTYIVGFSIMDPLAAYDNELKPKPYLAKSITSNADFKEWTIGLRSGVNLHNGKPVDADLVKKNLDLQKDSALTGEALAFVDEVNVKDPLTVVVTMNKPWSTFDHILTSQVGAIAAEESHAGEGSRKPIGSGPFVYEDWRTNQYFKVKKNGTYWRKGYPYLENIEFQPMPDVSTRSKALDSGGVQIFETNDARQILDYEEKARSSDDVQIFTDVSGDGSKIFIGLNTTKEPFNDPIARQAIAYAGDVVTLSEEAYEGVFPPAKSVFSENSPYYVKQEGYPEHDLAKAKQLAQEYEAKHGKKLSFTANITPDPGVQRVAQVLQAQAQEAGIEVILNPQEQLKLIVDALTGNYQATGFILFGSPHLDREYVFIASPPKPNGQTSLQFTRWGLDENGNPNGSNDRLVAAMDAARTTQDFEEQKKQYAIVQEEMAKNLNILFLVRQASAIVFSGDVHGARNWKLPNESGGDGAQGQVTTQTMTFNLWIQK